MRTSRWSFTLVELMIVVAIVMVLAAIAIPNFREMQLRAKVSELPLNGSGITVAATAYFTAHDTLVFDGTWLPTPTPGKATRAWETGVAFTAMGWRPDGDVRGQYKFSSGTVVCVGGGGGSLTCPTANCFWVEARADVDGNGIYACGRESYNQVGTGVFTGWTWISSSGVDRF